MITNRSAYQVLEKFGAIVVDERIVEDSNTISCGGVTAGIDLGITSVIFRLGSKLRE